MFIQEKPLRHWIDHFYGYGSWDARIWFVAFEDGGGDLPEEVAEKLAYFQHVYGSVAGTTLCDIRELYRNSSVHWEGPKSDIYKNLHDFRFGNQATLSGVWKNLIAFSHAYRDKEPPEVLDYQKNSFARTSEALIKLYPLPSPHNHAWYYSWLDLPHFGFLKSRVHYQAEVYPARINAILRKLQEHTPEVVLMYGMQQINNLKVSVQQFFPGVAFKPMKAIKQKIPQYHVTDIGETTLLITTQIPALRHNRADSGFDWKEFGRRVRTKTP
jgi:hypothetical protein